MKNTIRTISLALLASQAGLACQSADKGAATGESITRAADEIERGMQQLDATVAALHAITDKPSADLTTQRKAYEKSLASLESTAEGVADLASDMREKGKAYFAQWEKQLAEIQNEDIRGRSEERRKAIEAGFSKLQTNYNEAKDAFHPLLNDLRDIRTALKADLTMESIEDLKPTTKKVDKEAASVGKELKDLVEHFRELGVKLSRRGPEQKPEPEKK